MAMSASCSRARVDERAELVYATINLGEHERRVGKGEVVRESDGGRVATPALVLRSRARLGSDRVENNIGIGPEKVGTVLHPPAAKALADEMSLAAVSCVEVPAVLTIQVLHPCRQRVVRHFEERVDVGCHLAEGQHPPATTVANAAQQTNPCEPVDVVHKVGPVARRIHPDAMDAGGAISWPGPHSSEIPIWRTSRPEPFATPLVRRCPVAPT